MLSCMKAQKRSFFAGEEIYSFDTPRKIVGILLNGQASVIRYEYNGTRSILENLVECGYNVPEFLIKGLAVTEKLIQAGVDVEGEESK